MYSSLIYQLYVKEVYFWSFVTKSNKPISHAPNIHPHVFNSFLRTIIHRREPQEESVKSNQKSLRIKMFLTTNIILTCFWPPSTLYPLFSFITNIQTSHLLISSWAQNKWHGLCSTHHYTANKGTMQFSWLISK